MTSLRGRRFHGLQSPVATSTSIKLLLLLFSCGDTSPFCSSISRSVVVVVVRRLWRSEEERGERRRWWWIRWPHFRKGSVKLWRGWWCFADGTVFMFVSPARRW
ncbi:hypothetical protein Hanom_Chr03g00270571 [Helianthus anomalus]